jgi:hypothetical protein
MPIRQAFFYRRVSPTRLVSVAERKPVDPHDALLHALKALTEGHFDGREVQGAQANALESIAWSLAGLLADRVETAPVRPPSMSRPVVERHAPAEGSLSHELVARGFVPLRN